MASTARSAGRPRQAVLSRDLIMRTGRRLLDERGEQGAGIRDIAAELGVRPSALYNHIGGQDDLTGGIRELVSDRIDVSGFAELDWAAAVRHWARSYRGAFAAHPPTIAILAVRPLVPFSRTSRMYDAVCRGFAEAGWPESETLSAIVALESFILGCALDDTAPNDMLDPGDDAQNPDFCAAYTARSEALGDRRNAEAAFELGLEAMIVGLTARLEAVRGNP